MAKVRRSEVPKLFRFFNVYGVFGPSLLIESTDCMILSEHAPGMKYVRHTSDRPISRSVVSSLTISP